MVRFSRLRRALFVIGVACSTALSAGAQEPESRAHDQVPATERARWANERRAVRLGHEGLALYEASRYRDAYDRFQRAEQLRHSPVFLLYMARCRRNMGRLIDAADRFARLSRERVAEDAPAAWHGAVADADAELIALRREIPHVVVVLRGAPDARVTLDGRKLASSVLGKSLPLDPGRHSVVARDSKGRKVSRTFRLAKGQATTTVDLSFAEPVEAPRDSASASGSGWRTAGIVLLGTCAVGLGVGIGAALAR
jgi:hypothetical protein